MKIVRIKLKIIGNVEFSVNSYIASDESYVHKLKENMMGE